AEKNLRAGLKSGDFKFQLFGKKLKGEFVLVKLKGKEDNSWLLIKHHPTPSENHNATGKLYAVVRQRSI
ncbi:MAG: hypothetical protein ABIR50_05495, partial [Ginsengibacter sp.]